MPLDLSGPIRPCCNLSATVHAQLIVSNTPYVSSCLAQLVHYVIRYYPEDIYIEAVCGILRNRTVKGNHVTFDTVLCKTITLSRFAGTSSKGGEEDATTCSTFHQPQVTFFLR